jgi:hypothetical protein
MQARQNELVDIGCVEFLCEHIQEADDADVLDECLLVCATLMLGANVKSQDAFFTYFVEIDTANLIVSKIKTMLENHFDLTKKTITAKNAKLAQLYKLNARTAGPNNVGELPDDLGEEADMEEESGEDLLTIELSDEEGEGGDSKDPTEDAIPSNPQGA